MFRVTEYLGDYPLESQLQWGAKFDSFMGAYHIARAIWNESVVTTKVLDPDYYVLIEREDRSDDAEYRPMGAFTMAGAPSEYINHKGIKKFISRFEGM